MRQKLCFFICYLLAANTNLWAEWRVHSPNKQITVELEQGADSGLQYRALLNSKQVVGWSKLGLIRSDWDRDQADEKVVTDFSKGLHFKFKDTTSYTDHYHMVTGKQLENKVEANELALNFENPDGHPIRAEVRVFDTGIAFRYVFPDEDIIYHTVEEELTEFNLGTQGNAWIQPYAESSFLTPAYENYFKNKIQVGTSCSEEDGVGWAFPALFEIGGVWLLLHESGFDGNYHGTMLQPKVDNGVYRIGPPDTKDAIGMGSNQASSLLPWTLPWRFLVISHDLKDIVSNNHVFDLAAPQAIEDTSWIKPGVSSWSWWSDHDSSQNMDALKSFIDFSQEMTWPYSLIDANWNRISDTSMEELVDYADERGVDLLFWYNSGGRHNAVTEEPRNRLNDPSQRRAEFKRISQLGVKGIKIDFFQSDKQFMMQYYIDLLKDAADFHLMVNFHGCTIPRGWERTYPNLITSEAVRGAEVYSFGSTYHKDAPWHNTILPFTRNVIGSMDYTPITWTEWNDNKRHTSDVHEVALAVVFESGIQHYADSVEAFQKLPQIYKDFLTNTPTVWDETRYLAGYPGKDVIIARRNGDRWFIAGINGEATAKLFELDLSSFGDLKEATYLFDGEKSAPFASKRLRIPEEGKLEISIKPFGGFLIY